ncbi:MAG: hypothetical protein COA78_22975 [Blastopirellula sp.]|nr:MAG: hypothetical protein COA78_22975 [Blastopirellula sp.]
MSNNSLWNRLFGTSKKRSTTNHLDRFSEQFDTRLNFRELEPRMVLSGTAVDTDGNLTDSNLSLEISLEDGSSAIVTAEKMGSKAKVIVEIDGVKTNFTGITNLESIKLVGANDDTGTTSVILDSSLNIAELDGGNLTLSSLKIDGIDSTKIEASLSTPIFSITNPITNSDDLSVTQEATSSISGANLTIINNSNQSIAIDLSESGNDFNIVSATGGLTGDEITIADANDIILGDIEINQLTISADGTITQDGVTTIKVNETSDFTSGDADDVTLTNANEFTGAVAVAGQSAASGTVMISNEMALVTGNINAGALTLTAMGNISQLDNKVADATSATFVFSSTAATLDFDNTGNTFGSVAITNPTNLNNFLLNNDDATAAIPAGMLLRLNSGLMTDVTLIFTGSGDLALPAIDIFGDLTVQTNGNITQTAAIKVDGTASFISGGVTKSITLNDADNDFNIISAVGGSPAMSVSISDVGDIVLGTIDATTLTVTADSDNAGGDGMITQDSGKSIKASGAAIFTSGTGQLVTLTEANDFQGTVSVAGQSSTASGKVEISDISAIDLGSIDAATLIVLADTDTMGNDGAITDSTAAIISVTGDATFKGTSITVDGDTGNTTNFATLNFTSAGDVTFVEDSSTEIKGTNTALNLFVTSDDSITQSAGATITASGTASFTAGEGNDVTLTEANDFQDTISVVGQTLAAGKVEISDTNAIDLGSINAATLIVLADTDAVGNDGDITDATAAIISVSGDATFSGTSITVDGDTGNTTNFNTLNFTSAGDVTFVEDSDTEITGTNTANNLTLDSGGDITQAALSTITVTNEADFISGGPTKSITLANAGNDFNIISAIGGSPAMAVNISDKGDIVLGKIDATTLIVIADSDNTGTDGTITQKGATTISAISTANFTSGNGKAVTLTNANEFQGAVTVSGQTGAAGAVSITDLTDLELGAISAASLVAIADSNDSQDDGKITQDGATTITSGASSFTSGKAEEVTLANANDFTGPVSVVAQSGASGAVSITDTTDLVLGTIDAASLIVSADSNDSMTDGAITQDGATTITTGDAGFTSGNAKAVTLTNMNEFTGVVSVAGQSAESGNVEISDVSAIALGDITAASLSVIADADAAGNDGAITDETTADIVVSGAAAFSGTSIKLDGDGATTTTFGTLNFNSGGSVEIVEDNDTVVTGTNTADSLTLSSAGSITDTTGADIDVTNAAVLTAGTSITLGGDVGDVTNFGTLNFTAGAGDTVAIQEDSTTNLEGTNTAGNLVLESAGSIIENPGATIELTQPLFGSTTTGDAKFIVGADDAMAMNGNLVIDLFEDNIIRAADFSAQDIIDTIKSLEFKNVYNDDDLVGNNENKFTEASSPVLPPAILETLDIEYTHAPLTIESVAVGNILTDGSIRIVSGDGVQTKSADNTVVEDTFINDITNVTISATPAGKTVTGEFESDRWIQLADQAGDAININGDVSFKSNLGYLIEVGTTITADPTSPTPTLASRGTDSKATVNFGAVNFNTRSVVQQEGHVTIVEDSDMVIYGDNEVDSLFLHVSSASISDRDDTQIDVDGFAVFRAENNITLANHTNDVLDVTGNATFFTNGVLDVIDVGVTPQADLAHADRGVDSGAMVNFGSVDAKTSLLGAGSSGSITINEDSDTLFSHSNADLFLNIFNSSIIANTFVLDSDGKIEDVSGTRIDINDFGLGSLGGFAHFSAATTITLADDATDFIDIQNNAFFESRTGQAIDVGVTPTTQLAAARGTDSGATIRFGNLTFSSQNGTNGDVTIREDNSTQLAHTHLDDSNKADSLVLVSAGDITDAAKVAPNTATSINVTNFAEFNAATNIVLADNTDDQLTVGGNALFSSASSEFFAAPVADHRINVGVTDLDTTTMPTNVTRGTDSNATVQLGSVTFSGVEPDGMGGIDTHVTIREDNTMELANSTRSLHDNRAETVFLVTSDNLTDADGTDVTLEDFGVMIAGSSITLADNQNDSISIANNATFGTFTGAAVDIGVTPNAQMAAARGKDSKASVNFGSLHYTSNANSADITIFEDSNTVFDRGAFAKFETLDLATYLADSSSVTSAGTILDSTGTVFNNTAFAEFIAHGSAGSNQSITLADTATDKMSIAGNALFESTAGGDIEVGVLPTATAGAFIDIAATRGKDSGAVVDFGSLTTNSPAATSNVTVREDGNMVLSNSQRLGQNIDAGSLFFVASDSGDLLFPSISGMATITDATGTSINSVDLAVFRTDDSITLADNKGDSLTVGANATFYTTDLESIDVGVTPQADPLNVNRGTDSDAQVTFGSVHFSAENLLPALNTGGVTIYEDNDSLFDNTNQVLFDLINFGDQFARSIVFSSAGNITDAKSTSIRTDFGLNAADSFAHFSADNQITLADKSGDRISVLGNAFFESKTGQEIHVGVDPMKAVNALDRGADSDAFVEFGTLTVASSGKDGHVTINEDNATLFDDARSFNIHNGNTSIAESLTLHSDGSITDADSMTDFVVRDLAHFEARTGAVEFDIVLGNDLMNNQVDLSELFFIANDVSIVEQSDINSAADQGIYLYDGSTANDQISIQTSGHLIQVNDARPGAVAGFGEKISAVNGLFHAGGAVVLTNIEFSTLAVHAENTVKVKADTALQTTDPSLMTFPSTDPMVMTKLTSDLLPSFLPTSDSDTFAPPTPAPTDVSSKMDAASNISLSVDYSMVIENHGDLVIDSLTDTVGSVTKLNGIETTGTKAGHVFLETLNNGMNGDLTFNAAGISVDIANQKVFTALAAGDLVIDPLTELVSHVNSTLSDPVAPGFPGTQPFGPALTNTIAMDGVVTTISTYTDVNPAVVLSEGPSYEVNVDSKGVVQAAGNAVPLGYRVDIKIDKVGEALEKNNRLEINWDDGNSDVLLFEDGISATTTFNHFYTIGFPASHANQAFVTVNAYNDPLINLFDEVTSSASKDAMGLTGAKDLNFVTDTIRVVFKDPPPAPELPAPFVKPLRPVYEYPAVADLRSAIVANVLEFSDDPKVVMQIDDISTQRIINEITMEYGEKRSLNGKNLFSLKDVTEYIDKEPSYLPGKYEISIKLVGQQGSKNYKYDKLDPSSVDGSSSNHSLEYLKQLANSQEIERSTETAEQVWEQQYEQWFPTVVIKQIEDNSSAFDSKANSEGSDSTDQVSGYVEELLLESAPQAQLAVLNADNDLKLGESWKSRNRTDLALGVGGAMIMGAYAINTQAQNDRRDAVEETLSSKKTKIKFSKGTRLRERLKRIF